MVGEEGRECHLIHHPSISCETGEVRGWGGMREGTEWEEKRREGMGGNTNEGKGLDGRAGSVNTLPGTW